MISLIDQLLSSKVQSIIEEHKFDDLNEFLLKYKVLNEQASLIADQIAGRRKAKEKLPSWEKNQKIIYPPLVNIEQSSSEQTARYKVNFLTKEFKHLNSSGRMLDLTGGFGVDSYFMSKCWREVHFVEPNKSLLEIAEHNHRQLGAHNFHYYNLSAEEFLRSNALHFDFVYIDPSRRSNENRKTISLTQSEPNIIALQGYIRNLSEYVLIKTSPLLDIQKGIKDLGNVNKIVVVSLKNECKELLFLCTKNLNYEPLIESVDLSAKDHSFSFYFSDEKNIKIQYYDPMTYLYEPYASILKSGAFKSVAKYFNVNKIHPNTHLYTSNQLVENFPGRIFVIETFIKSDSKILQKVFPEGKASITTRNYPLSVDELRKKTGLKDGGEKFLIGFSGMKKKFLAVATKVT